MESALAQQPYAPPTQPGQPTPPRQPGQSPYPGAFPPGGYPRTDAPGTSPYQAPGAQPGPGYAPPGAVPPNAIPPQAAVPQAQEFEGAMRIATVGDDVIFASEVMPRIDKLLDQHRDKIPPAEFERQRWLLARQAIEGMLDVKRVMQDFKRQVPEDRLPIIREQVNESFEKSRLPHLLEALKVNSRKELEAKLREEGTSIKGEQERYFERSLAQQWLRQQTNAKSKFSHDELVAYYQANLKEFEKTAKVRWQQLSVSFAKHPSKDLAYAKLAEMGNAVVGGAPFEQVAKQASDGFTAPEGGVRDWTERGAMTSKQLEEALFTLPPNQLSQIIEGAKSFHIIRVLERVEDHTTSFRDAQIEIHEKLVAQSREKAADEYQARLREEIRVWTVFDDPQFTARIGLTPAQLRRR